MSAVLCLLSLASCLWIVEVGVPKYPSWSVDVYGVPKLGAGLASESAPPGRCPRRRRRPSLRDITDTPDRTLARYHWYDGRCVRRVVSAAPGCAAAPALGHGMVRARLDSSLNAVSPR